MTAFMNYLAEANISLLILLGFYKLILSRETNFSFQRYFMLMGILLSVSLPLIHFPTQQSAQVLSISNALPQLWLPEVVYTQNSTSISSGILWWVYFSGAAVFATIFLFRIIKLVSALRSANITTYENFKIIESDLYKGTFSFFNFIFIGSSDFVSDTEKKQVIEHEQVHAIKYHSFDILLLNILSIMFWFNPFVWAYKKVFIQLHEFEADARAVKNHDVNTYCNLLARVALQSFGFSLANHFNNSLTVKRIAMIKSIKKKISGWKLFLSITLFPCMFFLLACQDQIIAQQPKEKTALASDNDQIYLVVEEPPVYPGGFEKMKEFLSQNMRYPEKAMNDNIEGTVYVSFVVEKDGSVSDATIVKGVSKECDEEALRVVELFNPWIPGKQSGKEVRVKFVLPIKFKL